VAVCCVRREERSLFYSHRWRRTGSAGGETNSETKRKARHRGTFRKPRRGVARRAAEEEERV
jgi:hypothetical protein